MWLAPGLKLNRSYKMKCNYLIDIFVFHVISANPDESILEIIYIFFIHYKLLDFSKFSTQLLHTVIKTWTSYNI